MAAIIDIRTGSGLAEQHSQQEFGNGGFAYRQNSPKLRVIHGGKSAIARHSRRVFLMRRAVALLLVVAVLLATGLLVRSASAALNAQSASAQSGAVASAASINTATPYFVKSGDSLWSLAERIAPQRDPRDVVDQIVSLNADNAGFSAESPLRIGQSLRLPERSSL